MSVFSEVYFLLQEIMYVKKRCVGGTTNSLHEVNVATVILLLNRAFASAGNNDDISSATNANSDGGGGGGGTCELDRSSNDYGNRSYGCGTKSRENHDDVKIFFRETLVFKSRKVFDSLRNSVLGTVHGIAEFKSLLIGYVECSMIRHLKDIVFGAELLLPHPSRSAATNLSFYHYFLQFMQLTLSSIWKTLRAIDAENEMMIRSENRFLFSSCFNHPQSTFSKTCSCSLFDMITAPLVEFTKSQHTSSSSSSSSASSYLSSSSRSLSLSCFRLSSRSTKPPPHLTMLLPPCDIAFSFLSNAPSYLFQSLLANARFMATMSSFQEISPCISSFRTRVDEYIRCSRSRTTDTSSGRLRLRPRLNDEAQDEEEFRKIKNNCYLNYALIQPEYLSSRREEYVPSTPTHSPTITVYSPISL